MSGEIAQPNGVLVVDKPQGVTSHDVVNVIRRMTGTRRVGHAGTLDPMATGVLVLLVGVTTRLSQYAMQGDKDYRGIVRLGQTTTTYDADGEILAESDVTVDRVAIEAALVNFVGEIQQIPPMYAAIKVKGRKLYELAREGKTVAREPRSVTIYDIRIRDWTSPDLEVDVVCSSGTYIRSLAHDIGQALGCGAHLRALQRRRSGTFSLDQAHGLAGLETLQQTGDLAHALLPPRAAAAGMPATTLLPEQIQAVRYGQTINLAIEGQPEPVQALDQEGHLVAVLIGVSEGHYRPTLVMPDFSVA